MRRAALIERQPRAAALLRYVDAATRLPRAGHYGVPLNITRNEQAMRRVHADRHRTPAASRSGDDIRRRHGWASSAPRARAPAGPASSTAVGWQMLQPLQLGRAGEGCRRCWRPATRNYNGRVSYAEFVRAIEGDPSGPSFLSASSEYNARLCRAPAGLRQHRARRRRGRVGPRARRGFTRSGRGCGGPKDPGQSAALTVDWSRVASGRRLV